MAFDFFSTKMIDAFSLKLVDDLAARYPPDADFSDKAKEKRLTKAIEKACEDAKKFARENKFGFFKKAKLVNSFKWELKKRGYNEDLIKVATEGLVVFITRK